MAPRTRVKEAAKPKVEETRPTVADVDGEDAFAQLAKKHWLKITKKPSKVKVKPDVLKNEIWDVLEKDGFPFRSLLVLENLQILERYDVLRRILLAVANSIYSYLWPGFTEDSSNHHILLIVLIANVKTREHLAVWGKDSCCDGIELSNTRQTSFQTTQLSFLHYFAGYCR